MNGACLGSGTIAAGNICACGQCWINLPIIASEIIGFTPDKLILSKLNKKSLFFINHASVNVLSQVTRSENDVPHKLTILGQVSVINPQSAEVVWERSKQNLFNLYFKVV